MRQMEERILDHFVMARELARERLNDRLKQHPTIHYIASPWIPEKTLDGVRCYWWYEQCDVLLIAAAMVETVVKEFEQRGYTLVEVEKGWWQNLSLSQLKQVSAMQI